MSQCFVLGTPLIIYILYIIIYSDDLKSVCKLFADDTFFFFVFHEVNISAYDINIDLELIDDWAFEWKIF